MGEHGGPCRSPDRLSWWELWPMAGWGVLVLYLFLQGWMPFFLWWLYGYLAFAGGLVLLGFFVFGWVLRQRSLRLDRLRGRAPSIGSTGGCERDGHDHSHGHGVGRWWLYVRSLGFVFPVMLGFALPVRGLNDLAAIQRGADDFAMVAQIASQRAAEKAEWERGYAWTTVLGVVQRLDGPRSEKIGTLGFVVRTPTTPPGQFLLVRFLITCCAADAQPVAVPVRWAGSESLRQNQWVKVYGTTDPAKKEIVADDVQPVQAPAKPYL